MFAYPYAVMMKVKNIILAITSLYMLLIMHIYIPNMGGSGLLLPGNIIGWIVILLIILYAWCHFDHFSILKVNYSCYLFLIGILFLSIPIFNQNIFSNQQGTIRVLAVFGGLVCYLTFLQCQFSAKDKIFILWILVGSALVEAVLVLLQAFILSENNWMEFDILSSRPYGIFQQVNVMASFISTGLVIGIYLYIMRNDRKGFFPIGIRTIDVANITLLFSLLLFSMTIVLLQSRIGYLGSILSGGFLLMTHYKKNKLHCFIVVLFIIVGVFNGFLILSENIITQVSHSSSNNERLLILKYTWEMIQQKMWLGWGYGGFEYGFHHFLAGKIPAISMNRVTHPHNELLFWWVEGGVFALVGMLFLLAGYLRLLFYPRNKISASLWLLTLPITLHMMTEYPLYQSVAHIITLILLLSLITNDTKVNSGLIPVKMKFFNSVVVLFSLCALYFMVTGFKTSIVLTNLERGRFISFAPARELYNPYINITRYKFDEQMHNLILFNTNKDSKLLQDYLIWGDEYSKCYVDINVYFNMIKIAKFLNMHGKVKQLVSEARLLFGYRDDFIVYLDGL